MPVGIPIAVVFMLPLQPFCGPLAYTEYTESPFSRSVLSRQVALPGNSTPRIGSLRPSISRANSSSLSDCAPSDSVKMIGRPRRSNWSGPTGVAAGALCCWSLEQETPRLSATHLRLDSRKAAMHVCRLRGGLRSIGRPNPTTATMQQTSARRPRFERMKFRVRWRTTARLQAWPPVGDNKYTLETAPTVSYR